MCFNSIPSDKTYTTLCSEPGDVTIYTQYSNTMVLYLIFHRCSQHASFIMCDRFTAICIRICVLRNCGIELCNLNKDSLKHT